MKRWRKRIHPDLTDSDHACVCDAVCNSEKVTGLTKHDAVCVSRWGVSALSVWVCVFAGGMWMSVCVRASLCILSRWQQRPGCDVHGWRRWQARVVSWSCWGLPGQAGAQTLSLLASRPRRGRACRLNIQPSSPGKAFASSTPNP